MHQTDLILKVETWNHPWKREKSDHHIRQWFWCWKSAFPGYQCVKVKSSPFSQDFTGDQYVLDWHCENWLSISWIIYNTAVAPKKVYTTKGNLIVILELQKSLLFSTMKLYCETHHIKVSNKSEWILLHFKRFESGQWSLGVTLSKWTFRECKLFLTLLMHQLNRYS